MNQFNSFCESSDSASIDDLLSELKTVLKKQSNTDTAPTENNDKDKEI